MNIKQAKEQIRRTCISYLAKDEYGEYIMAPETQRPVFLVGAPGIGKTAIMSKVADELGLGLVDYSMTHHTRQSAIGLPFIVKRDYDGRSYDISEYTMSEIIASVYESMEKTGRKEGILFLDEINCVSETLEPAMLRFLQSKMFGNHRVPDGWVVISAGNPLEFNRSARPFDIVTLDRLKKIDVEPDYPAWREYALSVGAHPAVLSYLDLKPDNFYRVETQGRLRAFVTARAWMDLSNMMRIYEHNGLEIDESLIGQYVQIPTVAKDFCVYLELFTSYERDYHVVDIIEGKSPSDTLTQARNAGIDERMVLCGLLCDALTARATGVTSRESTLRSVRESLTRVHKDGTTAADIESSFSADLGKAQNDLIDNALHYRNYPSARTARHAYIAIMQEMTAQATNNPGDPFPKLAEAFNALHAGLADDAERLTACIDNALSFVVGAFGEGNELTILLTEMTTQANLSQFLSTYSSPLFRQYSKRLMVSERLNDLNGRLSKLDAVLDSILS